MQESPRLPQEQLEKNREELTRFRAEIAYLKATEKDTAHFRDINPEELIEEDAYVYQLFKDGTLDLNIFESYRARIQERGSRADFAAYLGNKIAIRELMAELEIPEGAENSKDGEGSLHKESKA